MRPARQIWIGASLAVVLALAGCGRKGDPRPPLRPIPGPLTDVSVRRVDERIELRFRVPAANADGSTPPAIERVEIYSVAAPAGGPAPTVAQVASDGNLKARIEVRRPELAPAAPPAGQPPPLPAAPDARLAPGDMASYTDTAVRGAIGPGAPTLYYVLVEVAGRRRVPSPPLPVPLSVQVPAPHTVSATYDERTLTLVWQPGAADQSFRVYEVDEARPLDNAIPPGPPVTSPAFSTPVVFDKRRCFVVRAVQLSGPVALESSATPPMCATPVDTFPPPAPADLRAFPGAGSIALTWSSVDVPDLGGYIVLRGEGAGDKLQPLGEPIAGTSYTDRQVTPGVTYWYAVRAVDKSPRKNESVDSNRLQATAR